MNTVASNQKQLSIRDHLESPELLAEIEKALPSHMSAERMARVAITAMMRTPDLRSVRRRRSLSACLIYRPGD